MIPILLVIAPLFLVIFVSAAYQRWGDLGHHWEHVLNEFALKIALPALLFSVLARAELSFSHEAGLLLVNSLYVITGLWAGYLIASALRLGKVMQRTLYISLVVGNVAYLGFPILTRIQGEAALVDASLIVAVYLFWMFTMGIGFLEYSIQKSNPRLLLVILNKLIRNPLLISVVLGLVVATFSISLPAILMEAIDLVATSVTPVVLVVIGLFIGKSTLGQWKEWIPVGLFSLTTLLLLPALLYFTLLLAGLPIQDFSITIIEAAMPLAITPFALADEYKLNKTFIARSIVLSTVFSVITLPFWISLFG